MNGAPLGSVYAIGDCATVQNNVADHLVHFLRSLAYEKGKDPETMAISFKEWQAVAQRVKKRFPQAADHLRRLDRLFEQYDKDKSGTLDFGELRELLMQIDSKLTSLPATAQRAHQQGQYLGHKFSKLAQAAPGMAANEVDYGDLDEAVYRAFAYRHLGSLAYVGNAAVFDIGGGLSFSGGLLAVYLWRSVYFAQSVSLRTRVLLAMDWSKRALFGRGQFGPATEIGTQSSQDANHGSRSHELLADHKNRTLLGGAVKVGRRGVNFTRMNTAGCSRVAGGTRHGGDDSRWPISNCRGKSSDWFETGWGYRCTYSTCLPASAPDGQLANSQYVTDAGPSDTIIQPMEKANGVNR